MTRALLVAVGMDLTLVLEVTAQRSDVIGPASPDLSLWQTRLGVATVPDLRHWYSIHFSFSIPPHLLSSIPHPSLWLPPCGCCRQDLQPDHRPVPLQGRRHWNHLQPLRQGLPAEPLPRRPLHQWVTNTHTKQSVAGLKSYWCHNFASVNNALWPTSLGF